MYLHYAHERVRTCSLSQLDSDGNCGFSVGLFMFHLDRIIPVSSEKKDFILTRFLSSSSFRSVQFRPGTHTNTNREERKKDIMLIRQRPSLGIRGVRHDFCNIDCRQLRRRCRLECTQDRHQSRRTSSLPNHDEICCMNPARRIEERLPSTPQGTSFDGRGASSAHPASSRPSPILTIQGDPRSPDQATTPPSAGRAPSLRPKRQRRFTQSTDAGRR